MNRKGRTNPSQWLRQVILKWPFLGLLIGAIILSGLLLESAGLAGVLPNQVLADLAFQTLQPLPDKFLFAIGAQAPVGQFNEPHDVAVAPDGTVYVTDPPNRRIQHFDATGAFLETWGHLGRGEGEFEWPLRLAVAPDGTVYVVDGNRIQRFSATGQFLSKWGSYGSGDGQFSGPNGVAVASDGTVYVAEWGNHRVQRFSATGQFLGKWGSQGTGDGQFNEPHGVAVAPDGTVYVADRDNHRIQRFSATGQFLGKWGSEGTGNGQFNRPNGVAVAPNGTVYVADYWNHRIQRFSATGQFLGKWGSYGSGDGQFHEPCGAAVAPDGTVYIADRYNHRVQRFSATGHFLGKWGSQGASDGQFNHLLDIGVGPDGSVYVADNWNNRVQRLSAIGMFLGKWGSPGNGNGQFNGPEGIGIAPDGTVYVADANNHRIQRFSATGQFLGKWGSYGTGNGRFKRPRDVAMAPNGTVYVVDMYNHRIQRFSATGEFLGKWGTQGSGDGQFSAPSGVAVAADGTVYVTDTGNNRIQRFAATGQFLSKWGSQGSGDGQFQGPWGITVAPDGTIYVTDWLNFRVQRFSSTGTFLGKWGWWDIREGAFAWPTGIAIATDGTAYVSEWDNSRVQAFAPVYPTTWRGEYFANRWLAEAPVLIRSDAAIDFDWGSDSPGPGVPAESFSARWYRYLWFEEGSYAFTVHVDDGVRLWVDGQLLVDQWWHPQISTYTADVYLNQGYHKVQMEYYEGWGAASARLSWQVRSPDSYEPDDTCAQANWIGVEGPSQSHTLDWTGDVDWVKFNATAGIWYEIKTPNLGSNADTVLELYDKGCGAILAANDDYMSGSLASRIIWVAPASGTYYVKARPYSSSRTGTGSDYDFTVATTTPHGIPLQVHNQAGDLATYFWTEAYAPGAESPIFRDWGGMSGYSFLDVPDGTYTLVAGSGNDHCLLMQQDVVAPSTLALDTGGTVAVDVYAYQRDASPLGGWTSVYLRPYYGSYGWVGRPDEDGYLNVDAIPANYNAFVWSWDYLYYLVRPNVGIWGPITLNLDARTMPTGQINVSLQGMDRAGVLPWGSYTSWAPYLTANDGDSIVLSPDSYGVSGYMKYTAEGEDWYYGFSAPEPLDVTAGGATTFRGGETFSASTGAEQPQYQAGQVVTITNTFQDAFANRLTWIQVYTPSPAADAGAPKEEAREGPSVFPKSGKVMEGGQQMVVVQQVSGIDSKMKASPGVNARLSQPELSGTTLTSWSDVYPLTTVRDPHGQVVFQDNNWQGFSTIAFTLPSPAVDGTYSIVASLDTGPHQGVIQGTGSFQVKLARVYLPLLLKNPYVPPPPTVCDGGFEAGGFSPCWAQGGELDSSVVEQLDTGEPTFASRYSALLGQPELGNGSQGNIPAGNAWIEQTIQEVPGTPNPHLTFWYRVISYDASVGSDGRLWDTFDVFIGEELVFRDDRGEARPPGSQGGRHDTNWLRGEVDLSHWRGQEVMLRFAVWNREYDGNGMDYFNTWAYLDQVQMQP